MDWQPVVAVYVWIPILIVLAVFYIRRIMREVNKSIPYLEDEEGRTKAMDEVPYHLRKHEPFV